MNISLKFQHIRNRIIGRLSLQHKILILFVGATILVLFFAVLYIGLSAKKHSIANAHKQIGITADKHAEYIQNLLEKELCISRTLCNTVQNHKQFSKENQFEIFTGFYKNVLSNNPDIIAVWDSWELKYLDSTYQKDYGRYKTTVWREDGTIKSKTELASTNGDSENYARIKNDKIESLEEPYFGTYEGSSGKEILMTSIVVPNIINDKFAGFVGVDIPLTHYYEVFKQIRPYEDSYAFLLSNTLKYVASPDKDLIGENALDDYEGVFLRNGAIDKINNGNPLFFEDTDINGINSYFTVRPILVGNCKQHWTMVIVVPKDVVIHESIGVFWRAILIGLLGIALLSLFIYYASNKYIIKPVHTIILILERLSGGHVSDDMLLVNNDSDEIGTIVNHLNKTVEGLSKKTKFAEEIGQGNYNASLDLLSSEDILGRSLIEMGQNLRTAQDEEQKRKIEDNKRQWVNEGLATFGNILRQDNNKIEVLSANIIRNLINYLNANQGGLFIYNDDDSSSPYFDLLAAYAYNRQKFITKNIALGEGLIGTCALEKQTIHLTNIPENYISISSGLGESKPRTLLIVPLKIEENVLGVVELASFNQFEDYHIDFVEKVAQSIAQTLISVRTNIRTADLLERTQQQAEEMKSQEEEVRQNLEELETIKEELEKRNEEFFENQKNLEWEKTLLDALMNYLPDRIYFKDLKSRFIKVSKSTLEFFGLEMPDEVEGKSDFDFFGEEHARPAYEDEQKIIRTNTPEIGLVEKEIMSDGSYTWAETSKMPLKNSSGETIGTFGITRDITRSKLMEEEINKQSNDTVGLQKDLNKKVVEMESLYEAIKNSSFVIEYNPEGYITSINQAYLDLFGVSGEDMVGKHHSYQMEFTEEQRKNYKLFWEDLINGVVKKETHKFSVNDKTYLFYETYSPLKDESGTVYKILKIAVNVSHLLTD
ncbi:MAG: PAS domain-containing protein [Bacteroidales bacterium]